MDRFSRKYRFADWPNPDVPAVAAGVYAIWDNTALVYCGMSGRELGKAKAASRSRYGLVTRLASHAAGRLSGDQFCVYVANRLVLPTLDQAILARFASGDATLDALTRIHIHQRFEYQFAVVGSTQEAYRLEIQCRSGVIFGQRPLLNPLGSPESQRA